MKSQKAQNMSKWQRERENEKDTFSKELWVWPFAWDAEWTKISSNYHLLGDAGWGIWPEIEDGGILRVGNSG